jgi:hypothetical protein
MDLETSIVKTAVLDEGEGGWGYRNKNIKYGTTV